MMETALDWSSAEAFAEAWKQRVVAAYGEPIEWQIHREAGCSSCLSPELRIMALVAQQPSDREAAVQKEMDLDGIYYPEGPDRQPGFFGSVATFDGGAQ